MRDLDEANPNFPPIVIVNRGNCTFVQKTMNAEKMGAIFLIIADNIPQDLPEKFIMIDDGRGEDLRIPAFLVSETHGSLLKSYAQQGEELRMKASLKISNPDNSVEHELYY